MLLKRELFLLLSDPLGARLLGGPLGCAAVNRFKKDPSEHDIEHAETDTVNEYVEITEKEAVIENAFNDAKDVFLEVGDQGGCKGPGCSQGEVQKLKPVHEEQSTQIKNLGSAAATTEDDVSQVGNGQDDSDQDDKDKHGDTQAGKGVKEKLKESYDKYQVPAKTGCAGLVGVAAGCIAGKKYSSTALTDAVANYGTNIKSQFRKVGSIRPLKQTDQSSGQVYFTLNMMTFSPGFPCTENRNENLKNDYPLSLAERGDRQFPRCKNHIGKYLAEALVVHNLDFLNLIAWRYNLDDILRGDNFMSSQELRQRQNIVHYQEPGKEKEELLQTQFKVYTASGSACLSARVTSAKKMNPFKSGLEPVHLVYNVKRWDLKKFTPLCGNLSDKMSDKDAKGGYVAEFVPTSMEHPLAGRTVFVVGVHLSHSEDTADVQEINDILKRSDFHDKQGVIFLMGDSGNDSSNKETSNQDIFKRIFGEKKEDSTFDAFYNVFTEGGTCCADLHKSLTMSPDRIATNLDSITTGKTSMEITIDPDALFSGAKSRVTLYQDSHADSPDFRVSVVHPSDQFQLEYRKNTHAKLRHMHKPVLAKLRLYDSKDERQDRRRLARELVEARLKAVDEKRKGIETLEKTIIDTCKHLKDVFSSPREAGGMPAQKFSDCDFIERASLEKSVTLQEKWFVETNKKVKALSAGVKFDTLEQMDEFWTQDKEGYRSYAKELVSYNELKRALARWGQLAEEGFLREITESHRSGLDGDQVWTISRTRTFAKVLEDVLMHDEHGNDVVKDVESVLDLRTLKMLWGEKGESDGTGLERKIKLPLADHDMTPDEVLKVLKPAGSK